MISLVWKYNNANFLKAANEYPISLLSLYLSKLVTLLKCLDWSKNVRAVFKWLSKVITWLRLLRLVIGLKDSRQFFNQWEAKPKPIAPCTRDFSRASSELQVIARNCDWFIALFAPVVIGRGNCFGFGFNFRQSFKNRSTISVILKLRSCLAAVCSRNVNVLSTFKRIFKWLKPSIAAKFFNT